MDTASVALFNIDHAELDMGNYTIRFWKGDYGSTARFIARSDPRTFVFSLLIGMAGGETGLYNNDGKGVGNDGGSLMSSSDLDNLGITNISLAVKSLDGKIVASVGGKRAWPNAYNMINHSKKNDIYTETTFSFDSDKKAVSFSRHLNDKIGKSKYKNEFYAQPYGKNVIIIWGKNNND